VLLVYKTEKVRKRVF